MESLDEVKKSINNTTIVWLTAVSEKLFKYWCRNSYVKLLYNLKKNYYIYSIWIINQQFINL